MKKALSLMLALVMALSLGAMAWAGDSAIAPNTYAPGSEISITPEQFAQTTAGDAVDLLPLKRDNYTVSVEWTRGGAMVDTVKLNDADGDVLVILKENYTITEAKDLQGTITLKAKTADKTAYECKLTGDNALKVTNQVKDVEGSRKADDSEIYTADEDNTIYVCSEDAPGYVTFKSGSDMLSALLKMNREEKVFMHIQEDTIDEVVEKYDAKEEAELYFFGFEGAPTLENDAALSLEADYFEKAYIYEYTGGKLREVNAKLSSDGGAYEWTSKKLTTYVVSDTKLAADAAAAGETADDEKTEANESNPNTGSADIVGVAAALAVVSLVTAGAIAMKK